MKDNDDCLKVDGKYMDWKKNLVYLFQDWANFSSVFKKKMLWIEYKSYDNMFTN